MFSRQFRQASSIIARRQFSSRSGSYSYKSRAYMRPAVTLAVPVVGYLGYLATRDPIKNDDKKSSNEPVFEEISEKDVQTPEAHLIKSEEVDEARKAASEEGSTEKKEGEEEAPQGAFNPETGEINWDCPCLGGMAYGPCGEEFKAAFSCFVYSTEEPKGIECVEKFQNMQNCFRQYPEVYAEELREEATPADDAATEQQQQQQEQSPAPQQEQSSQSTESASDKN
ncbi:hypothetical protein TRICI_001197 [Trichomonascus ciferrii]|uniref:Mitochondrial intermembrane space import and assembly protein 40 n=1 Tax=Trichomonascus ciferrii TaxID=44093 RepID=A0A642V9S3_9ASCO|nr:hypothetical protein TRICI_001197 [Trichomonascus ciferrii]